MIWLVLALGCGGEDPPGTLLVLSERGGVPATWVVGREERVLDGILGAVYPGPPDPRGTHALLVSAEEEGGHRERLWLVPLAGGSPVALTPAAGKVRKPAWSPDGSWIAFESDGASYRDIYRIDRDATNLLRLTDAEHGSFEPAVGPDGRIAFGTSRDGNAEIYVMGPDGSNQVRITDHPRDDVRPGWAADGTLAWISHRSGVPRVWLYDGEARPLRPDAGKATDVDHAWSPDGSRIAVVVQTAPQDLDIHVLDRSGAVVARIDGPGVQENPAWSPDGAWLAHASSIDGESDVWIVRADGTSPRRITTTPGADWLPRWLPTKESPP